MPAAEGQRGCPILGAEWQRRGSVRRPQTQRAALPAAADADRRVRLLHGFRLTARVGELVVLTGEIRRLPRQQSDDDLARFLEPVVKANRMLPILSNHHGAHTRPPLPQPGWCAGNRTTQWHAWSGGPASTTAGPPADMPARCGSPAISSSRGRRATDIGQLADTAGRGA